MKHKNYRALRCFLLIGLLHLVLLVHHEITNNSLLNQQHLKKTAHYLKVEDIKNWLLLHLKSLYYTGFIYSVCCTPHFIPGWGVVVVDSVVVVGTVVVVVGTVVVVVGTVVVVVGTVVVVVGTVVVVVGTVVVVVGSVVVVISVVVISVVMTSVVVDSSFSEKKELLSQLWW